MVSFSMKLFLLSLIPVYLCSDTGYSSDNEGEENTEKRRKSISSFTDELDSRDYKRAKPNSTGEQILSLADLSNPAIRSYFQPDQQEAPKKKKSLAPSSTDGGTPKRKSTSVIMGGESPAYSVHSTSSAPNSVIEEYKERGGSPKGRTIDIDSLCRGDAESGPELRLLVNHFSYNDEENDENDNALDWGDLGIWDNFMPKRLKREKF